NARRRSDALRLRKGRRLRRLILNHGGEQAIYNSRPKANVRRIPVCRRLRLFLSFVFRLRCHPACPEISGEGKSASFAARLEARLPAGTRCFFSLRSASFL